VAVDGQIGQNIEMQKSHTKHPLKALWNISRAQVRCAGQHSACQMLCSAARHTSLAISLFAHPFAICFCSITQFFLPRENIIDFQTSVVVYSDVVCKSVNLRRGDHLDSQNTNFLVQVLEKSNKQEVVTTI
jgi:hypothetical protein